MGQLLHTDLRFWEFSLCAVRLGPPCPFSATWLDLSLACLYLLCQFGVSMRKMQRLPMAVLLIMFLSVHFCQGDRSIGFSVTWKITSNSIRMSIWNSDDFWRTSMVWHLSQVMGFGDREGWLGASCLHYPEWDGFEHSDVFYMSILESLWQTTRIFTCSSPPSLGHCSTVKVYSTLSYRSRTWIKISVQVIYLGGHPRKPGA